MSWTDHVAKQVKTKKYKFNHSQDINGYNYYWFKELGIEFRVFPNGLEAEYNGGLLMELTDDDSLYEELHDYYQQLLEQSLEERYE